jgi:hypothetical protein
LVNIGQKSGKERPFVPIQASARRSSALFAAQFSLAADTSATSAILIRRFEGLMKKVAFILLFLGCMSFAKLQAATSTTAVRAGNSAPDPQTQIFKPAPAIAAVHLFPVNDAKGLLLTCIAPEIDTNPQTDVFRDCTLAPGRTLDDVMHTFIGAIHYVQSEAMKERADQPKEAQK